MENAIIRQVTLTRKGVVTIEYVQGTNTIPIKLQVIDYEIPAGSEARIFIKKPSGKSVYNAETISGQTVTIQPTTQMFAEVGKNMGTVELVNGDNVLATFPITVNVSTNNVDKNAIESSDEFKGLNSYVDDAKKSAEEVSVSRDEAKQYADDSKNSAAAASISETNAKTSETNAKASETAAATSEANAKDSETNSKTSETNAKASETASYESADRAETSETNAKTSETNAVASATAAADSASAAKASETNAATSESNSKTSEVNAKTSETNAKTSETNAKTSETASANSATLSESWAIGGTQTRDGEDANNSKYYAEQSSVSATNASNSETLASDSASSAKESETNAKTSETNAKTSETNAKASETASATSATVAATAEANAENSATAAATSEINAATSESNAATSATNAANSATEAASSATSVGESAKSAKESADSANESKTLAESWAVGGTGTRTGEDTSNAKYYANLAAQRTTGALKPCGTITSSSIPTSGQALGDMYNISDAFTTTDAFEEGAGHEYAAGSNIYWDANDKWDVLGGVDIIGVKGNNEKAYRTGNVNLTPDNIGAVPTTRKVNGRSLSEDIELTPDDVKAAPTEHKHSADDITSGVLATARIPSDAVVRTSPTHSVPSGADLNTPEYMVVGTYYSSLAANTFKNSAIQGVWMMIVLAPLGGDETPLTKDDFASKTCVYRVRYMLSMNGDTVYSQKANIGSTAGQFTYGDWQRISVLNGSADKVKNALTVQFNGTTNKTYDGSSAQTVNITPGGIGALGKTESAVSAGKLTIENVGDTATPVYFKNGIPVVCTDIKGGGTTIVQIPDFSNVDTAFTYTGEPQGPSVTYDTENITVSGATATTVGSHTMTFSLKDKTSMVWNDLTTGDKTLTYTIGNITVKIPTASGNKFTYTGSSQGPTVTNLEANNVSVSNVTAINAGSYTLTFTLKDTGVMKWTDGTIDPKEYVYTIDKAKGTLTLSANKITLNKTTRSTTVTVKTITSGATTTVKTADETVVAASLSGSTITLTSTGKSGTIKVTVTAGETTNYEAATADITVSCEYTKIYGVSWDGTSTTKWTRTDAAADFVDPVPYVSGATAYSSPFDGCMPWSGMKRVTRSAGEMVEIPKFWYKLAQNGSGMTIQIADGEAEGFAVDPAHMDRGDGKGERDVVYVGRYHCASGYKSTTKVTPLANITRSTARSGIHALGDGYWQIDFATRFTLWLLYLVEFADWNSQSVLGYGCGNNSGTQAMGYTDDMPYHTGTTLSSRTSYGCGTQYRYIEGLWDNVYDWLDGCYYNSNGLNIILNPNSFSDSANGTAIGVPSNGWPGKFTVEDKAGAFPTFIPTATGGSESTFSCDYWHFSTSNPCLCAGGDYNRVAYRGMFYVDYYTAADRLAYIGCRLLELP